MLLQPIDMYRHEATNGNQDPNNSCCPLQCRSNEYRACMQLLRRLGLVEARQLLLELREEVLSGRHEVRQGACAC